MHFWPTWRHVRTLISLDFSLNYINLLLGPFLCPKSTQGQDQGSPKLKKLIFAKIQNGSQGFGLASNFWVKKQKFHAFERLNWSAKSGAISTKNGHVMTIFPIFIIF